MPSTDKVSTPPATADDRIAAVLEQFTELRKLELANQPPRRLTYADVIEREAKRIMPFPFYQNGFRVDVDQLTDAQLALLPKLKAGYFHNRQIHVYRDATPDRGWHIDYPWKTAADKMAINLYGRDLTEILTRLTTEQPDLT